MNIQQILIIMICLLTGLGRLNAYSVFPIEGGISGGGGGTLPADPANLEELYYYIHSSKTLIGSYIRGIERQRTTIYPVSSELELFDLFFVEESLDIYELIENVQFELQDSQPCYTFDGKEVDASINTLNQPGICISIQRLLGKVSKLTGQSEIASLVLHELSHLAGADENLATQIQKVSIYHFASVNAKKVADWVHDQWLRVQDIKFNILLDLQERLATPDQMVCTFAQQQLNKYVFVDDESVDFENFGYLREKQREKFVQLQFKLKASIDYICSLSAFEPKSKVRKASLKLYNNGFQSENVVTARKYVDSQLDLFTNLNYEGAAKFPLVTIWIERFNNLSDVQKSIDEMILQWNEFNEELEALVY